LLDVGDLGHGLARNDGGVRVRFFFSSRRRHTRWPRDWSSDVCSSDLQMLRLELEALAQQDLPLSLTGFDEVELERLLAEQAKSSLTDADEAPALEHQPITLPGDLWRLGKHRLFCADATVPDTLHRVLQ